MFFGTRVDEATSRRLLDRYVEAGGNFLDTANIYAFWVEGGQGGESEALLGRWMRQCGTRDRVFVATKVGAAPGEDLSHAAINAAVDGSLRRLGTDHVDLYYAHVDHRSVPLEETLGAFGELVSAGKVRYIGCSNYAAWRLERARAPATRTVCRATAASNNVIPTSARDTAPVSPPNWSPTTVCWTSAARTLR